MVKRLCSFLQKIVKFSPKDRILLGVSGGVDSVVMLSLLKQIGFECVAVHCNFHLRGEESNRDEAFVRRLCERWNVPLVVKHFDTLSYASEKKISIEMAARALRYDFFEAYRGENNLDYICVAHHKDDSIETLLLNLLRGSGLKGLRGIQPRNGRIIRPLLCFSRKEIEEYAQREGLEFVEDSTNREEQYLRNRIRHRLLPLLEEMNPSIRVSLFNTSKHLAQTYELYQHYLERTKQEAVSLEDDKMILHLNLLGNLPLEPFLHYLLSPYGFSSAQIEDISHKEIGESGQRFRSPSHELLKNREEWILYPIAKSSILPYCEPFTIESEMPFSPLKLRWKRMKRTDISSLKSLPHQAYLDAEKVGREWILRQWQAGDAFIPFGMTGRKKVSDFLTSLKLSLEEKGKVCVLCTQDGEIVWMVGHRIDARFAVTNRTQEVLFFEVGETILE